MPCLPLPQQDGPDPLVAQLLENMQRRDLNDMEKAEGLARLRRFLAAGGDSDLQDRGQKGAESGPDLAGGAGGSSLDERLGALVGLAPRTVRRYLALRSLPPAVRDLLAEERLTVTQAQHLHQLPSPAQQEQVGARAAAEEWTAALVSRVCAALVRSPGSSLDEALRAAGGGWEEIERLGPAPRPEGGPPQVSQSARLRPAPQAPAAGESDSDEAGLWLEDATGAPTPEALGEPDPFAGPAPSPGARGAPGAAAPAWSRRRATATASSASAPSPPSATRSTAWPAACRTATWLAPSGTIPPPPPACVSRRNSWLSPYGALRVCWGDPPRRERRIPICYLWGRAWHAPCNDFP